MQEGLSYLCSSFFSFCTPQTKQAAQPKASAERQVGAVREGKVKTLRNRLVLKGRKGRKNKIRQKLP